MDLQFDSDNETNSSLPSTVSIFPPSPISMPPTVSLHGPSTPDTDRSSSPVLPSTDELVPEDSRICQYYQGLLVNEDLPQEPVNKWLEDMEYTMENNDGESEEEVEHPELNEKMNKYIEDQKKFDEVCKVMKDVLDKEVEKVVVSKCLAESPSYIVSAEEDWTVGKIQLEINPDHPDVENLRQIIDIDKKDEDDEEVKKIVRQLFNSAAQISGFNPEDLILKCTN